MEKKSGKPVMMSSWGFYLMDKAAKDLVTLFNREVKPTLQRFGMADDKHIREYIAYDSMEDIYRDLLRNGVNLRSSKGNWACFREAGCQAETPDERDFVFAKTPLKDVPQKFRETFLDSINVNGGTISFDREMFTRGLKDKDIVISPEGARILKGRRG